MKVGSGTVDPGFRTNFLDNNEFGVFLAQQKHEGFVHQRSGIEIFALAAVPAFASLSYFEISFANSMISEAYFSLDLSRIFL